MITLYLRLFSKIEICFLCVKTCLYFKLQELDFRSVRRKFASAGRHCPGLFQRMLGRSGGKRAVMSNAVTKVKSTSHSGSHPATPTLPG